MVEAKEVSQAEQKVINRQQEHWLSLPITQALLSRLDAMAKLQPPRFMDAAHIAIYNAEALARGAYQEVADLMRGVPYPDADKDTAQMSLDFTYTYDDEEDVN